MLKKLSIKSHWLIFFSTLYFGSILNLSFWNFIYGHIEITNFNVAVFAFSLIFFIGIPLYLLMNLIVVPYLAKPLLVILLLTSASTNYFMFKYGIMIDSDMVRNTFETTPREAMDLMGSSFWLWIFITGIIPSVLLAFAKIEYKSFPKELKRRLIASVLGILIIVGFAASSYKEYASFGRNNREARKLMNTVNYIYSTFRHFQRQTLAKREFQILDKEAKIVPFGDKYFTVLILVLGETARAKNFSLYGYERETNPLLSKQDIIHFKEVNSCGTATAVSVPCMFSHMTRSDFDADDAKFTENMLDILQTAGYDILWLENDDGCKGVCERVKTENMQRKNDPKYCNGRYCYDEVLLDGLENRLKDIKKDTLIVLHTMGSHGPTYFKRYPDKFKKFLPTCDTEDLQNCTREEIINTYDNTILYTDYIVSSTIDILKKFPGYEAGLIYISDHGESLGENNVYLHGFPYNIAPEEQKEVPMVLWMSNMMKKYDHIDAGCLRKEAAENIYTHDNLFHSVIGLLETKTHVYNKEYDIFKNCRTKELPF